MCIWLSWLYLFVCSTTHIHFLIQNGAWLWFHSFDNDCTTSSRNEQTPPSLLRDTLDPTCTQKANLLKFCRTLLWIKWPCGNFLQWKCKCSLHSNDGWCSLWTCASPPQIILQVIFLFAMSPPKLVHATIIGSWLCTLMPLEYWSCFSQQAIFKKTGIYSARRKLHVMVEDSFWFFLLLVSTFAPCFPPTIS